MLRYFDGLAWVHSELPSVLDWRALRFVQDVRCVIAVRLGGTARKEDGRLVSFMETPQRIFLSPTEQLPTPNILAHELLHAADFLVSGGRLGLPLLETRGADVIRERFPIIAQRERNGAQALELFAIPPLCCDANSSPLQRKEALELACQDEQFRTQMERALWRLI